MRDAAQLAGQISIFHTISVICLVLFIIMLAIDIFLFIRLDIWSVFGYLTGRTERKTVEQMMSGETSGKLEKHSKKKKKKGTKKKNTDKKKSKNQIRQPSQVREEGDTIFTPSGQLKKPGSDEVMLTTGSGATDTLNERITTDPITGQLNNNQQQPSKNDLASRIPTQSMVNFTIEREIMMVHTEETI